MQHAKCEMHELLTLDRLLSQPAFPKNQHTEAMSHFYNSAKNLIALDPKEWDNYGLKPLTLIRSAEHTLASEFAEPIEKNLAYLADAQNKDGSWTPSST